MQASSAGEHRPPRIDDVAPHTSASTGIRIASSVAAMSSSRSDPRRLEALDPSPDRRITSGAERGPVRRSKMTTD
jgi:hypothetical protein